MTCANASDSRLSVPLIDQGTGTLYVEGKVGKLEPVRFLVDTGSSYSTINQDLLDQLKQQGEIEFLRSQAGNLADGTRISVPLYRLRQLRIGDSCTINDIEVAVFPNNRRVILGLNVLGRLNPFAVSLHPPQLTLVGCDLLRKNVSTPPGKPSLAVVPE